MLSTPQTEIVPIENHDGVVRVGGTRVTLDTVVNAFNRSMSAEEIVIAYPALALADTYDVIAFYLRHQAEVDQYISEREQRAHRVRQEVKARYPEMVGIRARLQARFAKQKRE